MIGSLRGTVLERSGDGLVLLEVAGIGYLVNVMPRTLGELEPTTTAFLHIHHHIREDAQTLFGFLGRDERRTFDVLIATHGVGPALAMAILATHTPAALVDIVASADIGALTLVPGVGKKTAERLLVELKNRLSIPVLDAVGAHGTGPNGASATSDVRDALGGLGYAPEEIREVLRDIPSRRRPDHAARRAEAAGGPACVRSSSIRRSPATTTRSRRRRRGCGPDGSPISSANESSRNTSRSCSRRRGGARSRPITCCSPGHRASARPPSPASWRRRWASGCT